MKPTILATCDVKEDYYFLRKSYVSAIKSAGGNIIIAPPHTGEMVAKLINNIDGLFLTGGDDVHPRHYGKNIAPHYEGTIDEERYAFEHACITAALARNIPILGVCHGMQVLNVYFGGTLYQDLGHELPGALPHHGHTPRSHLVHEVTLSSPSLLEKITEHTVLTTNSFHHQGVEILSQKLTATGTTEDGLIESFEEAEHPWLIGVQWHPEELDDAPSKKLFAAFVNACHPR